MKKFFIIFILFFKFFDFSFANDDKICSKESKTVKSLYWKEVIFEFFWTKDINWEKSYLLPQDMKHLFYKDSWYICLEWKILHLNYDIEQEKYSINTKQIWEKILEKKFEFLNFYNAENNIRYKNEIYTWTLWFYYKDNKSDINTLNLPSWIFKFIYLSQINILNLNKNYKEDYIYSDWENIFINFWDLTDRNDFEKLKLFEYEKNKYTFSTKNWEDISYNDFIFINYFWESINSNKIEYYFIIKNKLFLNNWDLFFIKKISVWEIIQKDIKILDYNYKNFVKIKDKVFYLNKQNIIELWYYNDNFKIIDDKNFEKNWENFYINLEKNNLNNFSKNIDNFKKESDNFLKIEKNQNIIYLIIFMIFFTYFIIILELRNRKKEKEDIKKNDF